MPTIIPILSAIWKVLNFSLKLPVWLIAIAVIAHFWLQHAAVHKATENLVKRAELEAAQAKAEALQKIATEQQRRADELKAANDAYAKRAAADNIKLGNLNDQISEILAAPVNDQCIVNGDIFKRLQNTGTPSRGDQNAN